MEETKMLSNYSTNTLILLRELKYCKKSKRRILKRRIYEIELKRIQNEILRSENIQDEIFKRDFKRIEVKVLSSRGFPKKYLTNPYSFRNKLARFHILTIYTLLIKKDPPYWLLEKLIRFSSPVSIAFIKTELNAKSIEIFNYTKKVTKQ